MATKPQSQNTGIGLSLPDFLSIKDLLTIISVAVSLTLAWGVFTTRISLVEKEVIQLRHENEKMVIVAEKMRDAIQVLQLEQRQDQILIEQLLLQQRKQMPRK